MKKYAAMLGLVAMVVGGYASDITIWDGTSNSNIWGEDTRTGIYEDQEVETGDVGTQAWDLEAFKQDGNLLSMVGGYDFATKTGFTGGDIFIAVDEVPVYGDANKKSGSGNTVVPNTFNYDYAIDLVFNDAGTGGTYNVYSLTDASTVTVYYGPGYYGDNSRSNPWEYNDGGSLVYSGTFDYTMELTDAEVGGLKGGNHNQISNIDLSFIPGSNKQFWAHYTMECGNDNLMGHGTTTNVPEPGSLILFGTGLLGLIGLVVIRRKK